MTSMRSAKEYRSFRRPPERLPAANEMTGSLTHIHNRHFKITKRDRYHTLARIRGEVVPQDMDIVDGGDSLKVTSINQRSATWWLSTLKANYPQDTCHMEREKVKMKPETGLTLSVNQKDGTLKIKGKKHWDWFADNFERIMANAEPDIEAIATLNSILNRALRIDDGLETAAILKDLPRAGSIRSGARYIYRLWKGMLDKWMDSGARVVVASPSIDARRLADIYLLAIKNKGRGFQVRICTQPKTMGKKFDENQKEAREMVRKLKKLDGKKQLFSREIIDWALDTVHVQFLSFHCNFISGAMSEERNEIIITSANFNGLYFEVDARDSVNYAKMTELGLNQFYLEPLGIAQPSARGRDRHGSTISLPFISDAMPSASAISYGASHSPNGRVYQYDDVSQHSISSSQRSRPSSSRHSDISEESA